MVNISKEFVIIVIIILLILWFIPMIFKFNVGNEGFYDVEGGRWVDTGASYPVGYPLYGLRGDRLTTSNIDRTYISPRRQIRLSLTGADMYDSDYPPSMQGVPDCRKVQCPQNGYDNLDTCWQCGNPNQTKMRIPDLWPHSNTQ